MKKTALVLLLFAMLATLASPVMAQTPNGADGKMTKAEREYLMKQLKSTEAAFLASIKGLTPAQWAFKSAPDAWSIQECAEHIILAEDLIFNEAQKTLQSPAVTRLPSATAEGDREMVAMLLDRSKKAKAPQVLQPTGKFPTPDAATKEFEARRAKSIAYVQATQDPLRLHAGDAPAGGTADVYQFLLQMAAHSARHTEQINAVKTASGYPK